MKKSLLGGLDSKNQRLPKGVPILGRQIHKNVKIRQQPHTYINITWQKVFQLTYFEKRMAVYESENTDDTDTVSICPQKFPKYSFLAKKDRFFTFWVEFWADNQ